MPQFRASCPTGILAAGGGGTIFINGKQAQVKETGANALPRDPVAFSSTSFSRGGETELELYGTRRGERDVYRHQVPSDVSPGGG